MTTFIVPDYTIGNSADCQAQMIGVLQTLDQALEALEPAPNTTTVKFNDTILLTDGITSNTLDNTGYTTKNSVQNSTHYLNFSDNSATGIGPIQKTAGISCNPSTKALSISNSPYTITLSPQGITQNDGLGPANYIPSLILQANSNVAVPITPLISNPHQVVLQSNPVPIIDTLDPVAWTLPSGETINTYSSDSGNIFLGCESGNVYYFNTSSETWDLQATFDGAVRCIYYHTLPSKLYIGGNFNNMLSPAPIGGLNKVCYIGSGLPSLANVSVDIWNNYSVNGFDKAVNAIVANNDNIYFGGLFEYNSNSSLYCRFIATYEWATTGNLYALDNQTSGTGFNNVVWSLSLIPTGNLCVAGDFTQIITQTGSATAQYCCQLQITTTFFTVNQVDFLYSTAIALSNPISKTEAVQNDGTSFFISTNDSNINGNGINYFIGTGSANAFTSPFQIGSNQAVIQQQFQYVSSQTANFSIGTNSVYLTNNYIIATIPFSSPYLYWNFHFARVEFYDPTTGTIYAFIGSNQNLFSLQSGRVIENQGTQFTGGVSFGPSGTSLGFSAILFWNGSYYTPTWNNGGTLFN